MLRDALFREGRFQMASKLSTSGLLISWHREQPLLQVAISCLIWFALNTRWVSNIYDWPGGESIKRCYEHPGLEKSHFLLLIAQTLAAYIRHILEDAKRQKCDAKLFQEAYGGRRRPVFQRLRKYLSMHEFHIFEISLVPQRLMKGDVSCRKQNTLGWLSQMLGWERKGCRLWARTMEKGAWLRKGGQTVRRWPISVRPLPSWGWSVETCQVMDLDKRIN